jgi:hypothetical protein
VSPKYDYMIRTLNSRGVTSPQKNGRRVPPSFSPRGRRDLPLDLAAVCPSVATGDFRRATRVATCFFQALVQDGGERERGARRGMGWKAGSATRGG